MNVSVIYLVIGSCGEHEDYVSWEVTFKTNPADAEVARARCEREAAEQHLWAWNGRLPEHSHPSTKAINLYYDRVHSDEAEERREKMFDTRYQDAYWGVKYRVRAVYEEPSEDPWWTETLEHRARRKAKALTSAKTTVGDTAPLTHNFADQLLQAIGVDPGPEHSPCECGVNHMYNGVVLHYAHEPHCACGEGWPCPLLPTCGECGGQRTPNDPHDACGWAMQARESTDE